jgi:hypothetical protein
VDCKAVGRVENRERLPQSVLLLQTLCPLETRAVMSCNDLDRRSPGATLPMCSLHGRRPVARSRRMRISQVVAAKAEGFVLA